MRDTRLEHNALPLSHASVHSHERAPGIRGSGGGGFPRPRRDPRGGVPPRGVAAAGRARAPLSFCLSRAESVVGASLETGRVCGVGLGWGAPPTPGRGASPCSHVHDRQTARRRTRKAPTHPPTDSRAHTRARRSRPREVLLGAACARDTAEASLWASLIAARTARAGRQARRPPHRRRTSPRAGCP